MSLKGNIIKVFSANFLAMISGVVIGFIVPAVLSIEAYSQVKTYTLYISYIGFLHFGFSDGMYVKYGGKDENSINKGIFKAEHSLFVILEIIMTLVFVGIGIVKKDIIILLMGLSILPINTVSFHRFFYQSTGQFKKYIKITYSYTIIYLILNVLLALVFKCENYIYYCLTSLISYGIVYVILEIKFLNNSKNIKLEKNKEIYNNFKIGFIILLGNLSVMLFYAIDRWFVKIFLGINDFAYYSFAVSMLNVINLLVNSISITFYNYLAKEKDYKKINKIKKKFLLLGVLASGGYFVLSGIVSIFLKKYIPALSIISISFAAYPYMIVINALYINLYKTKENEKKYLRIVIMMLIISTIYNIIAIKLWKSTQSIAIATTVSFITWYFYSIKDFKYLKVKSKEVIYLLIMIISFLILSNCFNWLIGGVGYLITFIVISVIFYKDEVLDTKNVLLKKYFDKLF